MMVKLFINLEKYNLESFINKLRGLIVQRSILNHKLEELIIEYNELDKKDADKK